MRHVVVLVEVRIRSTKVMSVNNKDKSVCVRYFQRHTQVDCCLVTARQTELVTEAETYLPLTNLGDKH